MTRKRPGRPRTLPLLGLGCVGMLVGAAALGGDEGSRIVVPAVSPDPEPRAPGVRLDDEGASRWLDPPRADLGTALLERTFQHAQRQGKLRVIPLHDVLNERSTVTIVNVWATYCEPCKREFSEFADQHGAWGEAVTFVPIELWTAGSSDEFPYTFKQWRPLLDAIPGGTVQTLLKDVLPADAPIPITLALDCQDRLRWYHAGAIRDWDAFRAVVEALRAEQSAHPDTCTRRTGTLKRAIAAKRAVPGGERPDPKPPAAVAEPVGKVQKPVCENDDACSSSCVCRSGLACNTRSFRCPAIPKK